MNMDKKRETWLKICTKSSMGKSFEKWNFARHFGEKNNHTFKFKFWTPLLNDFPSCKPTFFGSYFTSFLWYGTSETLKVSLDSKAKLEQPRVQLRSPGRPRQSRSLSALHYPALLHYLLLSKTPPFFSQEGSKNSKMSPSCQINDLFSLVVSK